MFLEQDYSFIIETLMAGHADKHHMKQVLREDREIRDAMLADDRLFRRIIDDEEALLRISPIFYFSVLLRRSLKDLQEHPYTFEQQDRHVMAIFDSKEVIDLLLDHSTFDYIVGMMTSFVKIRSVTIPVRVKKGVWRKYRFSDFDVDSMIQFSQMIDEEYRFDVYCRIADICLFISGMFPEHFNVSRAPGSGNLRSAKRQEYEKKGRSFYKTAARHKTAQEMNLEGVLNSLAEHFTLAEKPISYISQRYLRSMKTFMFGV